MEIAFSEKISPQLSAAPVVHPLMSLEKEGGAFKRLSAGE